MGASDLTSADAIAIFSWDTSPLWRPFYAWGCNAFKSFLGMVLLESSFYITSPTYARRNGRPRAGIGPGQPVLLPRSQATAHNSLHAGHIVIRSPHQSSSWKPASGINGFAPTCPSQSLATSSGVGFESDHRDRRFCSASADGRSPRARGGSMTTNEPQRNIANKSAPPLQTNGLKTHLDLKAASANIRK